MAAGRGRAAAGGKQGQGPPGEAWPLPQSPLWDPEWGLLGVPWGSRPVLRFEGAWGQAGGASGCTGVIWGVGAEVPNLIQVSPKFGAFLAFLAQVSVIRGFTCLLLPHERRIWILPHHSHGPGVLRSGIRGWLPSSPPATLNPCLGLPLSSLQSLHPFLHRISLPKPSSASLCWLFRREFCVE